jgi:hypothetical protein
MTTNNTDRKNKPLLAELWDFLKVRKAWWLAPIITMLLFVNPFTSWKEIQ